MLMSLRAYATHRGCAVGAVQKALASGRIARDANGKIDSEIADRSWVENTDPMQQRGPLAASSTEGVGLIRSRQVREFYRAKMAQIEYDEKCAKLVDAEDVQAAWSQILSAVRTRILGLPSLAKQRSPRLTLEEIEILRELCTDALSELSGDAV